MANTSWTSEHTRLRDTLAQLYLDRESAQRVVVQAGINPALLTFSDNAANNWTEIIRKAEAWDLLISLVKIASGEFPRNETLKEVLESLHKSGGISQPAKVPQDNLPPISDVQLRDFVIEYFSKRDLGDLMLNVTAALQQDGKIPASTNIEIDTFSSTSEPVGTIALEMVKYFRRRIWTPFLITAVKEARPDVFGEKFGG